MAWLSTIVRFGAPRAWPTSAIVITRYLVPAIGLLYGYRLSFVRVRRSKSTHLSSIIDIDEEKDARDVRLWVYQRLCWIASFASIVATIKLPLYAKILYIAAFISIIVF